MSSHRDRPIPMRLPSRAGRVLTGIAAVVGLLAVVAGVPAVLLVVAGKPVPDRLPNLPDFKAALLTRDDGQLFLTTLGYLAWACWALLTVLIIIEVIAHLRGRQAPLLAGLGWAQWIARILVTGVTAVVVTVPSLTRSALPPPPLPAAAATAPATPIPTDAAAAAETPRAAAATSGTDQPPSRTEPSADSDTRHTVYTVQRRDTLWSIAERFLGDGTRYAEIATLNYGRRQPDGGSLTSSHWLQPGWRLILPKDAPTPPQREHRRWHTVQPGDTLRSIAASRLGDPDRYHDIGRLNRGRAQPDGHQLHDPDHIRPGWRLLLPTTNPADPRPPADDDPADRDETTPPRTTPPATTSPPTSPLPPTSHPDTTPTTRTPTTAHRPSQNRQSHAVSLPSGVLVSGALATAIGAAITIARLHRRRRYRAGIDPPTAPVGSERHPAARYLRRHYLTTHTDTDDRHGTDSRAPRITDPGDSPQHFVPIGERGGHEILVTLRDLTGLGLTGPGAVDAARALLTTILAGRGPTAAEVVIPEPDLRHLLGQDPADTPQHLHLPSAVTVTPSIGGALQHLETRRAGRARLLDSYDSPDLEAFRRDHPDQDPPRPVVLLAQVPDQARAQLTAILISGRRYDLAAVVLGDWPAGTSCRLDDTGHVTDATGPGRDAFDGSQLFHLLASDAATLLAVLASAGGTDAPSPPAEASDTHDDPGAAEDQPKPGDGPTIMVPTDPQVTLSLLGGIRVYVGTTELPTGLRDRARELLAYLAVHPTGVTLGHILADLWPDTDPEPAAKQFHTAATNIRRVLRTATGEPKAQFVVHTSGRYQLDGDLIDVDVWRFRRHLDDARNATTDTDTVQALTDAVDTYQADFLGDRAFEWSEPTREDLHRAAIDASIRLASHHEQHGNTEQALTALDHAVTLDPHNEDLYQRSIQLLATLNRTPALRLLYQKLKNRLAEIDTEPTPATERLVADHLATATTRARARRTAPSKPDNRSPS